MKILLCYIEFAIILCIYTQVQLKDIADHNIKAYIFIHPHLNK